MVTHGTLIYFINSQGYILSAEVLSLFHNK